MVGVESVAELRVGCCPPIAVGDVAPGAVYSTKKKSGSSPLRPCSTRRAIRFSSSSSHSVDTPLADDVSLPLAEPNRSAGVHPKVVQERLGHTNIGITLDTYSHVTAGLHSAAAERVAGLVFGGPLANG
jgi:integrase